MQGNKHRWSFNEDKLCCKKFVECYIVNQSNMDISSFVRLLQRDLPYIHSGSLRMKVQNIKRIALELKLKDTMTITPLIKYSMQNKKAMIEVLRETGI